VHYIRLAYQNKPVIGLSDGMDSHRHSPFAFHQLKDADVTLTKLVFAHKLKQR